MLCINQLDRDSRVAFTQHIPTTSLHSNYLRSIYLYRVIFNSSPGLQLFNLCSTITKFPQVDKGISAGCSNLILFGEYSFVVRLCFRVPQLSSVRIVQHADDQIT
jgi:hypothetical protein